MAETTEQKRTYKKTLNLPRTSFSMKANLVQNEPASLKRWQQQDLYARIGDAREGSPRFVFHDGPPYANGSIHLGHLLNKVLKDLVVRTRSMMGLNVPYIPGWDCHGLPIEHKVLTEQAERAGGGATTSSPHETQGGELDGRGGAQVMHIRRACRKYAEKYLKLQRDQMRRLLTLADYEQPYLTMDPAYEARVLEVFAQLVERGLVYRGLKPVHWSIENRTALAEAELEYYDREDTSVYVEFGITKSNGDGADFDGASLLIWTTTPWTLPANIAVAVAARAEYGLYEVNGRRLVVAADLASQVLSAAGADAVEPQQTFTSEQLLGAEFKHPFVDRVGRVVAADYVTLEDGTGLVHTAPGHGVEDYQTALREGLEIYCPVRGDGTFDDSVPDWLAGKSVWEANDLIVQRLRESGHLFHAHTFSHSYPHDWRSKTPTIFRATEQWFISVDTPFVAGDGADTSSLRNRALHATNAVEFFPAWGRNRMRGMLESRPDWCISRQRAWGLPIPAFYPPLNEDGDALLTPDSVRAVAAVIEKHGSDAWFAMTADDLLADYDADADPVVQANPRLHWVLPANRRPQHPIEKSGDILDVWFESGSSWHAALQRMQGEQDFPADLYLEGSDQHRGWFQVSLLNALGVTGQPPFKAVLTHGFMVDKEGRKYSKSAGHTIEDLFDRYGADVLRWWVSGQNTDNDVKVDEQFFNEAGDEYRKVRNTVRFLLSNLGDFDPAEHRYELSDRDAASIDAWALGELRSLEQRVIEAYERYTFRRANEAIFDFCNDTLSAVYLTAVKDRLYCDAADPGAPGRRRRTQTVLHRIADALLRLLAPIMPHTADEAWRALHGEDAESVHLQTFAHVDAGKAATSIDERWTQVTQARGDWLKAIEEARQFHEIDNPLDCGLVVPAEDWLAAFDADDLADLCGVSRFRLDEKAAKVTVVDLRDQARCERCWKRVSDVQQRSDGGQLCDRCAAAVGV